MVYIAAVGITTVIFGIGSLLLISRARNKLTDGSIRRFMDNFSICLAFILIFSMWQTGRSIIGKDISVSEFSSYPELIFIVFAYIGFIMVSYRVYRISKEFGFKEEGKNIEKIIDQLVLLKKRKGRLFLIGIGGSAANCSHAVNDFRKIAKIETYAASDNIAELTARINDEGWDGIFSSYLEGSHLSKNDMVFILSVSGGDLIKNKSINIVHAILYAKKIGSTILAIVGAGGGFTKESADYVIEIKTERNELIIPFAESMQSVIWHAIVNHPKLTS